MTRELLILRHGKSDWSTGQVDFDRPLKSRGKRGAQRVGLWLRQQNLLPDLVLSSPAERAIVTAQKSCKVMGKNVEDIKTDPRIYGAGSDELIALLQQVPADVRRMMLVGHNPGLEDLLMDLSGGDVPIPEDGKLLATATLARLTVECEWAGVNLSCAQLMSITRGASLPKKFTFPEHDSSELRERPAYYYCQSSVIPYQLREGKIEILIVSSSQRNHWVVPKGIKEPELSLQASAAQEALEEAGVEGEIGEPALGTYYYEKWGAECCVHVFPMQVNRLIPEEEWEEQHRGRRWVSPVKAMNVLKQQGLVPLVERLVEKLNSEN